MSNYRTRLKGSNAIKNKCAKCINLRYTPTFVKVLKIQLENSENYRYRISLKFVVSKMNQKADGQYPIVVYMYTYWNK